MMASEATRSRRVVGVTSYTRIYTILSQSCGKIGFEEDHEIMQTNTFCVEFVNRVIFLVFASSMARA